MNKVYQVIFQDEWNNLYLIGFYKNLEDSIDDINLQLANYDVCITKDNLKEYPGTFGACFDLNIAELYPDKEDLCNIEVRGFIFEKESLIEEIEGVKSNG